MESYPYIYIFLFSFFLSLILTPLAKKTAQKAGLLDHPGIRKIHKHPKPLLGGIAIYLSFLMTVVINMLVLHIILSNPRLSSKFAPETINYFKGAGVVWGKLRVILAGGTMVLVLGLIDDLRNMRFRVKLAFQVISALLLIVADIKITLFMGNIFLSSFITILWVVGITNAFNLLDNMDGLSSGVATIATVLFFVTAIQQGQFLVAAILIAFAGSIVGFLGYNFHPASIFMGDAGSLFIGYTLGSLTVLNTFYSEESPTLFPLIMPVLILGVPIFDTLSVIWLRRRQRESIFQADKRHFSHRLVSLGMTQKQAVLLVYLVTFCVGIQATLLRSVGRWGAVVILIQAISIFGIIISLELAGRKKQAK